MNTIMVLCTIVGVCFGENLSPPAATPGAQRPGRLIDLTQSCRPQSSSRGNECADGGKVLSTSSGNILLETCSKRSDLKTSLGLLPKQGRPC